MIWTYFSGISGTSFHVVDHKLSATASHQQDFGHRAQQQLLNHKTWVVCKRIEIANFLEGWPILFAITAVLIIIRWRGVVVHVTDEELRCGQCVDEVKGETSDVPEFHRSILMSDVDYVEKRKMIMKNTDWRSFYTRTTRFIIIHIYIYYKKENRCIFGC